MLKIVVQIKEKKDNNVFVGIKQITEKEFNNSTQNEKVAASQIKGAIEAMIFSLSAENKKEGEYHL